MFNFRHNSSLSLAWNMMISGSRPSTASQNNNNNTLIPSKPMIRRKSIKFLNLFTFGNNYTKTKGEEGTDYPLNKDHQGLRRLLAISRLHEV